MTKEEAINMLHGMRADNLNLDDLYTRDKYDALEMAIKALEQEPILDKIRTEIDNELSDGMIHKQTVLGIIDKYKAESEEKDARRDF